MSGLGPLADHAARLLAGTGIDPDAAAAVATGTVRGEGIAAAALADGWRAAEAGAADENGSGS